jgi:hypothetical protein
MKLLPSYEFVLLFSSSELIKKWVVYTSTVLFSTNPYTSTYGNITDLDLLESIPYRTKITDLCLGLKVKTAKIKGCKFRGRQC